MALNRSFRERVGEVSVWISECVIEWSLDEFCAVAVNLVDILGSIDAVSIWSEANNWSCVLSVSGFLKDLAEHTICFV